MKPTNRYAVLDLGTNKFSLLILEKDAKGEVTKLHSEVEYVYLGSGGLETICEEAFQRGIKTLAAFKAIIDVHEVSELVAFGTAGLRAASNSEDFIQAAKASAGIDIEIISGKEEARLIHLGVVDAIPPQEKRMVIMDIGGGSVEFIIADNEQVLWSESFPIGVTVLHKRFHHDQAITDAELAGLETHLNKTMYSFYAAMQEYGVELLVGTSGTFDVLGVFMRKIGKETATSFGLDAASFQAMYDMLLRTTFEERSQMEEIPEIRAEMLVVALVLIRLVLNNANVAEILVSEYAMREGLLKELMSK